MKLVDGTEARLTEAEFIRFEQMCREHGFKKRGKAFFRIVGNQVVQVLKFADGPRTLCCDLCMGLYSMYDQLEDSFFTSALCLTPYSVCRLRGQKSPLVPYQPASLKEVTIPPQIHWWAMTPGEQLELLNCTGFSWLNNIQDQQQLARALCFLDTQGGGEIQWVDMRKFAPFLLSGNQENAAKVVRSYLKSHAAPQFIFPDDGTPELYLQHRPQVRPVETRLLAWLDLALSGDLERIQAYAATNHEANCKRAKFCMKK